MNTCTVCGKEFEPSKYVPKQKVCGDKECQKNRRLLNGRRHKAKVRKYYTKTCAICQKEFSTTRSGQKYCGNKCFRIQRSNEAKAYQAKHHERYKAYDKIYKKRQQENNTEVYQKSLERDRNYYYKNKEKILEYIQEYRQNNLDIIKQKDSERHKKKYLENPEYRQRRAEYSKRWAKNNPDKVHANYLRRDKKKGDLARRKWREANRDKERATKLRRRAHGDVDDKTIRRVYNTHKHQCIYCGSSKKLSIEHMVPVSRGGTNEFDNLALACLWCNTSKLNRLPLEYIYFLLRTHQLNIHPNGIRKWV